MLSNLGRINYKFRKSPEKKVSSSVKHDALVHHEEADAVDEEDEDVGENVEGGDSALLQLEEKEPSEQDQDYIIGTGKFSIINDASRLIMLV